MERTVTTTRSVAVPASGIRIGTWSPAWSALLPLWRYGVWGGLVFVLIAWAVTVRLEVGQLQQDLARNARLEREALILNDRLQLEWSVRRRAATVEQGAGSLGLTEKVGLVRVEARP